MKNIGICCIVITTGGKFTSLIAKANFVLYCKKGETLIAPLFCLVSIRGSYA